MAEREQHDAETKSVLVEVDRFVRAVVAPRVMHPEQPMDRSALSQVIEAAEAMGLASADDEPNGLGLWEELELARAGALTDCTRSVSVLARIARANCAVALALHQRAVARVLLRYLRLANHGMGSVVGLPWGSIGIGREPLVRLLAQAPLTVDGIAILADVYSAQGTRVLTVHDDFGAVLLPCVDAGGALRFELRERAGLRIRVEEHAHGFDELRTYSLSLLPAASSLVSAERALPALALALRAEALAHVAICWGALQNAHGRASAYAAQRKQGGQTIDRHAAVGLLLARGRTVLNGVAASMKHAASGSAAGSAVIDAFAMRAEAQPQISAAINDALQVFGGLGYMRDIGIEKLVRDTNHLRVLGGSPRELSLIVAEWERFHV